MNKPSICCVVPSIRPERMAEFRKAWGPLFERHSVTLITVRDGDSPEIKVQPADNKFAVSQGVPQFLVQYKTERDLFCHKTDAVRNYGFVRAAARRDDYILTLDDDVHPPAGSDPIQEHLDVLQRRVPISWMNTASVHEATYDSNDFKTERYKTIPYLRGFPYGIRDEAPVKVSHGVWVNVPDFDGKTQLELGKCETCGGSGKLESEPDDDLPNGGKEWRCHKCNGTGYDGSRLPYSLPYFRGTVPRGSYFPFCGMNVMVHRDALPYLYFAPMGPDSYKPKWIDDATDPAGAMAEVMGDGDAGLNRFADIWCGILLKRAMDANDWAIYTGASTVIHTRASDPFVNVEQERLGVEWNEWAWRQYGPEYGGVYPSIAKDKPESYAQFRAYWKAYLDKAARFRNLIRSLQGVDK